MPKNYVSCPIRADVRRRDLWKNGQCPYCGSDKVTEKIAQNGSIECACKSCKAVNRFKREATCWKVRK